MEAGRDSESIPGPARSPPPPGRPARGRARARKFPQCPGRARRSCWTRGARCGGWACGLVCAGWQGCRKRRRAAIGAGPSTRPCAQAQAPIYNGSGGLVYPFLVKVLGKVLEKISCDHRILKRPPAVCLKKKLVRISASFAQFLQFVEHDSYLRTWLTWRVKWQFTFRFIWVFFPLAHSMVCCSVWGTSLLLCHYTRL